MMHKVITIGRLGRDPYTMTTKNGNTFTTFTVATDGPKGTTWFKVETWGKLAEVCGQYLRKGRLVYVEGTVSVELWHSKEGEARASLVINARTVKFLDSNGNGHKAGAETEAEDDGAEPDTKAEPEPEPTMPNPEPEPTIPEPEPEPEAEPEIVIEYDVTDFDFEDLPF